MQVKFIKSKISIEKEEGEENHGGDVTIFESDAGLGVYLISTVSNTIEYHQDGSTTLHSLFGPDGVYSHACVLAAFIENHPELRVVSHSITTVESVTLLTVTTEPR